MNYKTELFAFIFSIVLSVIIGMVIIPLLRLLKVGQNILRYVDNHKDKAGTTTIGGLIFAISAIVTFLLFSYGERSLCFVCLSISVSFLIVGFLDDLIKVRSGKNEGLSVRQKLLFQLGISTIVSLFSYFKGYTNFFIPFVNRFVDLKWFGVLIIFFTFIATTNCVNLTDGLDGLAGGVSYVFFALICALINIQIIVYGLNYTVPEEYKNLALLSLIQSGALLGFLFYNTYRAKVFMGDTGSLYLGGLIASTSIFSGNIFFIPLFGIMFVVSGISVIVQVVSYRRTGKRVFLMSPLHHHFEYKGHSENKIVFVYKLITLLAGMICIITIV